jgi:hypothetical protein
MFYSNKVGKNKNHTFVVQIRKFEKKHVHRNLELRELLQLVKIGETSETFPNGFHIRLHVELHGVI